MYVDKKANLHSTTQVSFDEHIYIYSGNDVELSDLDDPGTIITQLPRSAFTHMETFGNTVELVVQIANSFSRIVFLNGCMDRFRIQLLDQSFLDTDELDEHIYLAS